MFLFVSSSRKWTGILLLGKERGGTVVTMLSTSSCSQFISLSTSLSTSLSLSLSLTLSLSLSLSLYLSISLSSPRLKFISGSIKSILYSLEFDC
jgi:hypothetical protein